MQRERGRDGRPVQHDSAVECQDAFSRFYQTGKGSPCWVDEQVSGRPRTHKYTVSYVKFIIFHHKQRNIENLIPQLNLNEQIIERVTDFDFLGLTIDQHLTWNGHVQKISNKISRSLGIMCELKWFLPQNILKNSLILPHLQYCILSWGFKSDRIFQLQKRAIRIITCSKYNAHTEPLLKTLNLLKIEDIMKTKALKLYYRYKQNELPKYFESMFTESNDNHSHDTRHKSLLYQLPTKTSTGRLCIRHYIPEQLSKTPECILKCIFVWTQVVNKLLLLL